MVTDPEYVPARRLVAFAVTLRLSGVVPVFFTVSQPLPDVIEADAVKLIAVPFDAETESVSLIALAPVWALNVSTLGETVMVPLGGGTGAAVTVRVTGTVTGDVPAAETVTEPG